MPTELACRSCGFPIVVTESDSAECACPVCHQPVSCAAGPSDLGVGLGWPELADEEPRLAASDAEPAPQGLAGTKVDLPPPVTAIQVECVRPQPAPSRPPASDADWFIFAQGRESGPFTVAELQAQAAADALGPEDLVRSRQCAWALAKRWPFLAFDPPSTSAPPAPARQPIPHDGAASGRRLVWPVAAVAFVGAFLVAYAVLTSGGTPSERQSAPAAVENQPPRRDGGPEQGVDKINAWFNAPAPARPEIAPPVYELTEVDITEVASFHSSQASIFGLKLGMSRVDAWTALKLPPSLMVTKHPKGQPESTLGWDVTRKGDGQDIMGLYWGLDGSLSAIGLYPDSAPHLRGNSKRLLTADVLDAQSDLRQSYLGQPDKVRDETDRAGFGQFGFTAFLYCYSERGLEFYVTRSPRTWPTVRLDLVK
jgi:hypothetical protein